MRRHGMMMGFGERGVSWWMRRWRLEGRRLMGEGLDDGVFALKGGIDTDVDLRGRGRYTRISSCS